MIGDIDTLEGFLEEAKILLDKKYLNNDHWAENYMFNALMIIDVTTLNQVLPRLLEMVDEWGKTYDISNVAREGIGVAHRRASEHLKLVKALDIALSEQITTKEKAALIFDILVQYVGDKSHRYVEMASKGAFRKRSPVQTEYIQKVLQQPSAVRQEILKLLLTSISGFSSIKDNQKIVNYVNYQVDDSLHLVLEAFVASELPLSEELEQFFMQWLSLYDRIAIYQTPVLQDLVINLLKEHKLPLDVVTMFRLTFIDGYPKGLKEPLKNQPHYMLNAGEAWADAVLQAIKEEPAWRDVVACALNAQGASPKQAWWDKAQNALKKVKQPEKILEFLVLVGQPRTVLLELTRYERGDVNLLFDKYNSNAARGLAWMATCVDHPDVARVLAGFVETSLKKVKGVGPRSPKIATAGVYALSLLEHEAAVTQLAYLKSRVTFKTTLKQIEKALRVAADRAGVSKEDLEEMSVPTFGLDSGGKRVEHFGEARAELSVLNGEVKLTYFNAKGKQVKAPPASVKQDFADELKELKASVKDIGKMLSATAVRIEKHHLSQKTWEFEVWLERYIHAPLVAAVAKRLIWRFSWDDVHVAGVWHDGSLKDVQGHALDVPASATVSLWHPLDATTDELLAWRDWLQTHYIRQPWKQAHREIYILTDAERGTGTYSNRYAAHILKQHQFNQLCALRGWQNQLRLAVDDTYQPARIDLSQWNLRAEYWIEGIGEYGDDTTEAGTYLRVATDQVRFYPLHAAQNYAQAGEGTYVAQRWREEQVVDPLPLEDIPPLVFSEVMRDVDLFVGVASVGNDPTWQDGGPDGRFVEYWRYYGFGDLTESAQSRKEVLEQLLPRLKIRDRVSINGKFLYVQGDIRTYKIHLGSSNILMEPNDQYLCIVPDTRLSKKGSDVFLPFEGDRTLSLILSKALLLAEDTKIKDNVIVQQIKRN
jgi:hypothetical protein